MTSADISTFPVFDASGAWLFGPKAIAQCVARRYMTPRGLLEYDPDFGLDLREWLNKGMTPQVLAMLQGLMQSEAEKDERVLSAAVRLTWTPGRFELLAHVDLETTEGDVTLTLSADKVTVQILAIT